MDHNEPPKRQETGSRSLQREWARRVRGPVQFREYTAKGYNGGPFIFFEFSLDPGQDRIGDDVYGLMKEHKTYPDGYPTGLTSRKNGCLWSLPENESTRALAECIKMSLKSLAERLEAEQQRDDGIDDQTGTTLKTVVERLDQRQGPSR